MGKTSSIKAYMDEKLKKDYNATIGVDVTTIKVPIKNSSKENEVATLTVWDLAGQSQFANIRKQFYLGANAAILIFDVTKKESFQHLNAWIDELKNIVVGSIPLFLVGNKIDLPNRVISLEEMNSYGKTQKDIIEIHETSALTGIGIRNLFHSCSDIIFSKIQPKQETKIEPEEISSIKPKKSAKKKVASKPKDQNQDLTTTPSKPKKKISKKTTKKKKATTTK